MAIFTFNLPDIGEGIAEAEIVEWFVAVGDRVEEDDRLAGMMTDKATVEMESPVTGTVTAVAGETGDVVAIGAMLVEIEVEGQIPGASEAPDESDAGGGQSEQEAVTENAVSRSIEKPQEIDTSAPKPAEPANAAKVLATPAVRARARDLSIDLARVKPAADGRVRHSDLDQFLSYNNAFTGAAVARDDESIKIIGMRRRIAESMAASKRNIPHFSYVEECDVTALESARADLNTDRGERPKLTLLPLIITAICKTLPDFPMINARYDDEAGVVTRHGAVHMGMAAQTDAGLMVPVIRDAHARNPWQLAAEILRLAEAARDGTATSQEMSGATLTVTSLGALGGVATTPVINRPEVAIIGPNRIIERPMYVPDGAGGERIEKRKLMNISISCDHRVVDGWDAASFVQAMKRLIERPVLLFAE